MNQPNFTIGDGPSTCQLPFWPSLQDSSGPPGSIRNLNLFYFQHDHGDRTAFTLLPTKKSLDEDEYRFNATSLRDSAMLWPCTGSAPGLVACDSSWLHTSAKASPSDGQRSSNSCSLLLFDRPLATTINGHFYPAILSGQCSSNAYLPLLNESKWSTPRSKDCQYLLSFEICNNKAHWKLQKVYWSDSAKIPLFITLQPLLVKLMLPGYRLLTSRSQNLSSSPQVHCYLPCATRYCQEIQSTARNSSSLLPLKPAISAKTPRFALGFRVVLHDVIRYDLEIDTTCSTILLDHFGMLGSPAELLQPQQSSTPKHPYSSISPLLVGTIFDHFTSISEPCAVKVHQQIVPSASDHSFGARNRSQTSKPIVTDLTSAKTDPKQHSPVLSPALVCASSLDMTNSGCGAPFELIFRFPALQYSCLAQNTLGNSSKNCFDSRGVNWTNS